MRGAIIVFAVLATTACHQPQSKERAASWEEILAPGRKIAARAKEPDAEVVLQPYNQTRDQAAASECKATYVALSGFAHSAPLPLTEKRQLQIQGRVASHRIDALVGKPEGTRYEQENDERFVVASAYLQRHHYFLGGMSPEEIIATLNDIKSHAAVCDKALAAWGAPEIDEKPDRDEVNRMMAQANRPAASPPE